MGVYKIPTGTDGKFLDVQIPDKNMICYGVPREVDACNNLEREIKKALDNPIGSPGLKQLVNRKSRVCLLVDDATRPTPAYQILPTIIRELDAAGVQDSQIKLILAAGLHRMMTKDEIEDKVGKEMTRRFSTFVHSGEAEVELTYIGESSLGTPIWVNKHAAESDVIIGIGCILSHHFAGYSGGAKIILPGISGRQTVTKNHNSIDKRGFPGNPESPFRLDMEEIARKVGLKFKVDVVMNSKNEIVGIFAGDFVEEHRKAVQRYNEIYQINVPEKVDIVLTTTLPKKITFVQGAAMPIVSMPAITKPGGTIIIFSPALEGFSFKVKRTYEDDLRARLTIEQIGKRVKENSIFEAITFAHLAWVRDKFNFVAVAENGNLYPEDIVAMGLGLEKSLDSAMQAAFSKHGKDAKVAVIPYGFSCTVQCLENRPLGG
jgi:nickel-dependent lactate racemase